MAGVETISLAGNLVNSLTAAKSSANVTAADSTQQFEQFLKNDNSTANQTASVNTDKSSDIKEFAVQDTGYAGSDAADVQTKAVAVSDTSTAVMDDVTPEQIEELQSSIRDIVKDALDISDDTLDAVMENMGIAVMDLLNPAVLQQFVLIAEGGSENTEFLTNEDLMQSFTDLLQTLEDFQADNQNVLVSMMDELDAPVPFEEFLQQEGMEVSDVPLMEADMDMMSDETDAVPAQEMIQSEALPKDEITVKVTRTQVQTEDTGKQSEGKITESGADVITVEKTADTEKPASQTEEDNPNEMFFSDEQELPKENETAATPLFAEQFDTSVQDGVTFLKPDVNASQRMQQMIDIVNQVSESIRSSVNENTTSVELQLNPESLGKVYISLVSKAGVMTATFHVQTEEAKNALESQILLLRDNLEAKNLKVESVEVEVSDFSFTQSNQTDGQNQNDYEKQGKKKFRYDAGEAEETEEEVISAEQVRRQVMRDSGGSIDFTA